MTPRTHRLALGAAAGLLLVAGLIAGARWASAADHRDSALLTSNPAEDIADVFAFRSPTNPANLVLAMTVSGLIPPAEASTRFFDPTVLYQFKIDQNADAVEDLVVQAFVTGTGANQVMQFRGPAAPTATGPVNRVLTSAPVVSVPISTTATARTASGGGLTVFAGVRDDPFFFDLGRYQEIIAGQATSFRNPGMDTFAGTNVLAIVVELPIASLGPNADLGVWGTTSR